MGRAKSLRLREATDEIKREVMSSAEKMDPSGEIKDSVKEIQHEIDEAKKEIDDAVGPVKREG